MELLPLARGTELTRGQDSRLIMQTDPHRARDSRLPEVARKLTRHSLLYGDAVL